MPNMQTGLHHRIWNNHMAMSLRMLQGPGSCGQNLTVEMGKPQTPMMVKWIFAMQVDGILDSKPAFPSAPRSLWVCALQMTSSQTNPPPDTTNSNAALFLVATDLILLKETTIQ